MATKFDVTAAGELSAKNGPGDLQTEKQFDNFVLQLECKTNGKFLNSGVFFRCVPGKFWSGYEAQIRNEWLQEVKLKDGTTLMPGVVGHASDIIEHPQLVADRLVTFAKICAGSML